MKDIMIDGKRVRYYTNEEQLFEEGFFGFIYITQNLTNNKYYVGKRRFVQKSDRKLKNWRHYLGSGRDLIYDVRHLGVDKFRRYMIAVAKNVVELEEIERHYIHKFDAVSRDNWYNIHSW